MDKRTKYNNLKLETTKESKGDRHFKMQAQEATFQAAQELTVRTDGGGL